MRFFTTFLVTKLRTKETSVELAQKYVHLQWLHTRWATSKILTQVFDSELIPLKEEAFGPDLTDLLSTLLPGVRGAILRTVLSFAYFALLIYFSVWLFSSRYPLLGLGGHPKPAIEGHFKTGQR